MVKITTRALKIGVLSRFYPISTVGFRTFSPENFGQAYWSVHCFDAHMIQVENSLAFVVSLEPESTRIECTIRICDQDKITSNKIQNSSQLCLFFLWS